MQNTHSFRRTSWSLLTAWPIWLIMECRKSDKRYVPTRTILTTEPWNFTSTVKTCRHQLRISVGAHQKLWGDRPFPRSRMCGVMLWPALNCWAVKCRTVKSVKISTFSEQLIKGNCQIVPGLIQHSTACQNLFGFCSGDAGRSNQIHGYRSRWSKLLSSEFEKVI